MKMAKEKRSLFSRIFHSDKSNKVVNATRMKFLNGYQAIFTTFDGKIYEDPDVRACIDAIARNGAKLNPKHIQKNAKGYKNVNGNLQRLLSEQPNEFMNAYDFYYYVISEMYIYNDAYIYISRNDNLEIEALYPLHYGYYEFYELKGDVYIKFQFGNGNSRFVSIKDLIHIKRFIGADGMTGGNNIAITKVLSMKHLLDEGIINAIKTTQSIKGVLKETNSMIKEEDRNKMKQEFINSLNTEDNYGFGVLDATMDFKEITLSPITATDDQAKMINDKVLSYFGISENILRSTYTENEWNAFYESVLEPIGLQMGIEFTNKMFTIGERYHGNKIIFTSNRLQYASNNTKINLLRYANNYMTVNELREVLNLEPIDDGDKIMQDLNHIDSNKANEYQVGKNKTEESEEEDE